MRSVFHPIVFTLLSLPAFTSEAFGQLNYSGYSIGINLGTLVYQGDLTPKWYGYTRSLKPAIGLTVSKALNNNFSLRVGFTHGKLSADESIYSNPAWRQHRNFKFSTPVNELSGTMVFNPYGENSLVGNRKLSTYIFAGAGITFLNIKRDWSGYDPAYFGAEEITQASFAADTAHSLPRAVVVLPVGIGLKYTISQRLFLNLENTLRFSSSDYLDGFRYRGQNKRRDAYYGLAAGVNYRFGKSKFDCPTVFTF